MKAAQRAGLETTTFFYSAIDIDHVKVIRVEIFSVKLFKEIIKEICDCWFSFFN